MGFESLKNIIDFNKEQAQLHPHDEDLENDICPTCAWNLRENSKGEKACPICGRVRRG